MTLEPNPDDTWLLAGSAGEAEDAGPAEYAGADGYAAAAGEAGDAGAAGYSVPDDGPPRRAHHAHRADPDSSLIALGKGVAAVIGGCAAVALVVLALDLGRSSPKSHPPTGKERGLAAALPSTSASSGALSIDPTSAKPKRSASSSPSSSARPTHRASTSAAHAVTRSSPAQAVPPPRSTTSRTRAPSPPPTPTPTSHLSFTIPGHTFTGSITISMPKGWTITGSSGGSRDGNTWHVILSQISVQVAGPHGSHKTMTATVNPTLGPTTTQTYALN